MVDRARELSADERGMNLAITFDLRRRLGLPATFLGSEVMDVNMHLPGSEICDTYLNIVQAERHAQ